MKNRKKIRLKNFDYSSSGNYFVTICENDRKPVFGNIDNGQMILNEFGNAVKERWLWLQDQYSYVKLDAFVVMPDHIHGIICIDHVGDGRDRPLRGTKIKPLPELIGAFKTTSSKIIHQLGYNDFKWQRSFYDHIIRNGRSLGDIRKYILENPIQCPEWDDNGFIVRDGRDRPLRE